MDRPHQPNRHDPGAEDLQQFWHEAGPELLLDCMRETARLSKAIFRSPADDPVFTSPYYGSVKWVTRARVKVDRVACPWLIQRFIDREATFLFVPPDQVQAVAKRQGATPFDIEGVELGHHGDRCSFDAFLQRFGLDNDAALQRLSLIVRGADTNRPELAAEAAGLQAVAHGLSGLGYRDERLLELQFPIYDALYAHCGGPPPETSPGVP